MKTLIVVIAVTACVGPAWAQGGFIGVYSDPAGSSCELVDATSGLCSYYVVHSLAPGTSGSRFRVVSQHTGLYLNDAPVFNTTVGTSQSGVSIYYGGCIDASAGLHVLTVNYFCQGTTPPCATVEVISHPDGFSALDCSTQPVWIPLKGWTSYINNDGSCPCGPPGYPEMSVGPGSLTETICPDESKTQTLTIANGGASDLEFEISVDRGTVAPPPSVLYFTELPSIYRVGERALVNLGITYSRYVDYGAFLTALDAPPVNDWDLVVFEPSEGTSSRLWPDPGDALWAYLFLRGGALISSSYNFEFSQNFYGFLDAFLAGNTAGSVFRWTNHSIFDTPNVVPDLIRRSGSSLPLSSRFDWWRGAQALAGYVTGPAAGEAAIVMEENGNAILNGMSYSAHSLVDSDADGKDDIVELVENEILHFVKDWLSVDIVSGTVSPGASTDVTVAFRTPRLGPGDSVDGEVRITSNDPNNAVVAVPAHLDVAHLAPSVSPLVLTMTIPMGATSHDSIVLTNDTECEIGFRTTIHWVNNPPALKLSAGKADRMTVDDAVASLRRRSGIPETPRRKTARRFSTGELVDIVVERPERVAVTQTAPVAEPAPAVAVLAALAGDSPRNVINDLVETLQTSSVTLIDVALVTPTLTELEAFDAVMVWWDFPYDDAVALGNNLADYVDGGGGVVLAVPETAGEAGSYLGGRWEAEQYFLIGRSDFQIGQATLGTVLDPGHLVMSGVSNFDGGSFSFRPSASSVTTGASLIAVWSDGMPLVAAKEVDGKRRVDLGFFPFSATSWEPGFWQPGTDGARLMGNALEWVSGFIRWLSVSPASGRLAGGGGSTVSLTFDATDLPQGAYEAEVIVAHSDASLPEIIVPVTLQVGEPTPVFIKSFAVRSVDAGVEASWDIWSDEQIMGFRVYRGSGVLGTSEFRDISDLIPTESRTYVDDTVTPGTAYDYVLAVVQHDGSELRSPVAKVTAQSLALELYQNYPNPFNPATTIRYDLPEASRVNLHVYDVSGRMVRVLRKGAIEVAGRRSAVWDGRDEAGRMVASGVYFYRLEAGAYTQTKRMVLLK